MHCNGASGAASLPVQDGLDVTERACVLAGASGMLIDINVITGGAHHVPITYNYPAKKAVSVV
jgi:hypothetical protein